MSDDNPAVLKARLEQARALLRQAERVLSTPLADMGDEPDSLRLELGAFLAEGDDPKAVDVGYNDDGSLDELFAQNAVIHIEQMSDTAWWLGIYPAGEPGQRHTVWFTTARATIHARHEQEAT